MQVTCHLYPHSQSSSNKNLNFAETEVSAYDFLVPTDFFPVSPYLACSQTTGTA